MSCPNCGSSATPVRDYHSDQKYTRRLYPNDPYTKSVTVTPVSIICPKCRYELEKYEETSSPY
jgi:hypothetical protein